LDELFDRRAPAPILLMFSVGKVQVAPGLALVTRCAHYRNRHRGSLHTVRVLCRPTFGAIVAPRGKFPGWSLGGQLTACSIRYRATCDVRFGSEADIGVR